MMVLVGDNLLNETHDDTFVQELNIESVDFHPNYDNKAYFDVAIITTQEIIDFNHKVQPICLPKKPVAYVDNREGDLVTITGWGLQQKWNFARNEWSLNEAQVSVFSQK